MCLLLCSNGICREVCAKSYDFSEDKAFEVSELSKNTNDFNRKSMVSDCLFETFEQQQKCVISKAELFGALTTDCSSLLRLENSTLNLLNINCNWDEKSRLSEIDSSSSLFLADCDIHREDLTTRSFIESSGTLILSNVSIESGIHEMKQIYPLAEMTGNSFLSVHHCIFTSITVESTSMLFSGVTSSVDISQSVFKNITKAPQDANKETALQRDGKVGNVKIEGCMFNFCDNPYYGAVVFPSSDSFAMTNSSFNSCMNYRNIEMNRSFYEKQTFSSGNVSFTDCFFKCSSNENGGALNVDGESTTCSILRCHFNECSVNNTNNLATGGCISIHDVLAVSCVDSNFTHSNASYCCGGCFFHSAKKIQLRCCIVAHCSSMYYAGMQFIYTIETEVSSCLIHHCNGTILNGGIEVFSAEGFIVILECYLHSCFASDGGAINFHREDRFIPFGSSISYCLFSNNTVTEIKSGRDITLFDYWIGKIRDEDVVQCYSTSNKPRATDGETNKDNWLHDPPTSSESFLEFFVSSLRGKDLDGWGDRTRPFKTVSFCLSKRLGQKITVCRGEYEEGSINVGSFEMNLIGDGIDNSFLTSHNVHENLALFIVEGGALEVIRFSLVHSAETSSDASLLAILDEGSAKFSHCEIKGNSEVPSTMFSVPFMDLRSGITKIDNCKFQNIYLLGNSLILTACVGNLEINGTSFSEIKRNAGNGSVFEIVVEDGENMQLSDLAIEKCSCNHGNGGAIKADMKSGSRLEVCGTNLSNDGFTICSCSAENGESEWGAGGGIMLDCLQGGSDFVLSSISFSENSAIFGKNVFVVGSKLEEVCSASKFAFPKNETSLDELMGFESSEIGAAVPLILLWEPLPSVVIVSGRDGVDHIRCGFAISPCSTIEYSEKTNFSSFDRKIKIAPPFEFDRSSVLETRDCEIYVEAKGTVIEIVGDSSLPENGFIETRINADFSNITFQLPSTLPDDKPFLCCSKSVLKLLDCGLGKISSEVVFQSTFCSVVGGQLNITNFLMTELSFDSSFVLSIGESSDAILDGINMTKASGTDKSLIVGEQKGAMAVQNCTFESFEGRDCAIIMWKGGKGLKVKSTNMSSVTRQTGNGSGICLKCNDGDVSTVSCVECKFNLCAVDEEQSGGGGIYGIFEKGCEIEIDKSSFKSCRAPGIVEGESKKGKGGGLLLDVTHQEAKFVISEPTFKHNSAEFGKNLFLLANDLNKSVTKDSFVFDYSKMKDDSTLFEGSDDNFANEDLFRFLVQYTSNEIHVSAGGLDVLRCGAEDDPCRTLWRGTKQIDLNGVNKKIIISESCVVSDLFDLSDFSVRSSSNDLDRAEMAVLMFENLDAVRDNPTITCEKDLLLSEIVIQAKENYQSLNNVLLLCQNGLLRLTHCKFDSLATPNAPLSASFVRIDCGRLDINELNVESINIGRSMIVVNDFKEISITDIEVRSCNISGGSIFETSHSNERSGNRDRARITVTDSVFEELNGLKDESRAMSFKDTTNIDVLLNESVFSGCQSTKNQKGGTIMIELEANGCLQFKQCTIEKSGCSTANGMGGGLFLRTDLKSDLDFLIEPTKFDANTAFVGRDVFVECESLETQINEKHFRIHFNESFIRQNALFGIDRSDFSLEPVDLLDFILIYQSDTIIVSSDVGNKGEDSRNCGTRALPCISIGYGLYHLTDVFESRLIIDKSSSIEQEVELKGVVVTSRNRNVAQIRVCLSQRINGNAVVVCSGASEMHLLSFLFSSPISSPHISFISATEDMLIIEDCLFGCENELSDVSIPFSLINISNVELIMNNISISDVVFDCNSLISIEKCERDVSIEKLLINNVTADNNLLLIRGDEFPLSDEARTILISGSRFMNTNCHSNVGSTIFIQSEAAPFQLCNSVFDNCKSSSEKGSTMSVNSCLDVSISSCIFNGYINYNESNDAINEDVCKWNGSFVDVVDTSMKMTGTSISNCSKGGLSVSGGWALISEGWFENNNPLIDKFHSVRRNVICSDGCHLNINNSKGGDGVKSSPSMWVLNKGCELEGLLSEISSPLFIPVLNTIQTQEAENFIKLKFYGSLFLPCNLSFQIVAVINGVNSIETYEFEEDDFTSENEIHKTISSNLLSSINNEAEVFAHILFGDANNPSSTDSFILKNGSVPEHKGDERLVEGGNEGKLSWAVIIAIIFVVLFLIVLIVSIVVTIRWRRAKNEAEDLREIVNDNIRKDPKAFEMVTMEMSPEEQWRRAEREAEKKNEERIKKRVFEKNLGHSESSEHLLSESGSTEYILGKDSDKIPEWALEKDEEEEIRKRTPSPSISSTSTTDTSDTESTFVRGEDMCPTTSSMSNLVDAMACSSPHEKLIVDLRDSLFMLLHGKNKTKEMAIGSLKEREQTAAQILFWVANLALHSFDEMENELSSLVNLSPHIVLFSEHMVICVALHSDCSSGSDTSSISSTSTIATSSSDVSVKSERFTKSPPPSSAFEDEDDNRKECMRWKAPELLINKNMGATKESVAFSIGMMLWECLTLNIPFGEYEAEVAGQKIVNGERPNLEMVNSSSLTEIIQSCVSEDISKRIELTVLKREFIQRFPKDAVIFTVSDAVDVDEDTDIPDSKQEPTVSFETH
ncbi:uncharacterized protein MONOS_11058 [Monocercomonoides exilis]|uniref:uncharacterized protein n=1 Tax=Monocercomonoides exilis TaxID=2049356 RepID=UPI00355A1E06|nr:hypothetical protein MONOS_11058 [Monocercomonoides exilis]|eukprot:MONOS_11058.1-p1 / transcript=MONOS_11058.1 / gene=MONOS_11058 / organism=Monocercomonoides_exilis_PA203 / gene_product=unspecified product / transcript_product=unspecified product / location=Mono_scaffold00533:28377-36185(+) / protein_length=2602 / sequence_SO=supercontig / SO=protein_coding / is_pseudo=false